MLYLASQFLWFLVAAFVLGFVMGWVSHEGGKHEGGKARLWGGVTVWIAVLWACGAVLTWFQFLNGVPATWVETALLFAAVYFAGCVLASLICSARAPAFEPAAAEAIASPIPVAAPIVATEQPLAATPPPVEGEADIPGQRPAGLVAARDGKADDLKLIKGIGRQNEGRLHGLGIWHFEQVAAWTPENVEWVGSYLAFPGRIEREAWIDQARALAAGTETEFAARAKAGLVASSRDDGSLGRGNVATLSGDSFEGERPNNTLIEARGGKPDDLTLIKGVGPAIAGDLNRLGIWHFTQIATLRDTEIRYISAYVGFPGRGIAENWREDADILANGGETAHSRAVKAGRRKPGN
jgi:predicted flap endonuclease-1-like 5' DNA nuclease